VSGRPIAQRGQRPSTIAPEEVADAERSRSRPRNANEIGADTLRQSKHATQERTPQRDAATAAQVTARNLHRDHHPPFGGCGCPDERSHHRVCGCGSRREQSARLPESGCSGGESGRQRTKSPLWPERTAEDASVGMARPGSLIRPSNYTDCGCAPAVAVWGPRLTFAEVRSRLWVRAWMSAVCAARCQRSRGAVVLSATGRSEPEPSAWGRVTTSARLSFDRRSTAAPGLTPDGEGGGGEGGAPADRNLSEVRWRPRVRPAQRASCGETMINGGMDDDCPCS
jgi:hypothetical protein